MTSNSPIFVATLGGKPQIVTFALDTLLAEQGVEIQEVLVLHVAPSDPSHRLHRSLSRLQNEFHGGEYRGQPCRFRAVPLRDRQGRRLPDFNDNAVVSGAWSAINQVIGDLKEQGRELHLCLTGGRRLMAMLAMSVAVLQFDYSDRIWQLYTPDSLREAAGEGKILHTPADGPQPSLLEVPIMPGTEAFPALRYLLSASPEEVRAARHNSLEQKERILCERVWKRLTARQKEVLKFLAQGETPQDVARELHITLATVSSHQSIIYDVCREVWALPEDVSLNYRWLQQTFGRWPDLDSLS